MDIYLKERLVSVCVPLHNLCHVPNWCLPVPIIHISYFVFQAVASPDVESSSGAEWLKSWRKTVSKTDGTTVTHLKAKPGLAIGEIDAKSVIPDDLDQSPQRKLSVLSEVPATAAISIKPESTTFKEKALDDVDLE